MNGFKFFRIFGAFFMILGAVLSAIMGFAIGGGGLIFGVLFILIGGLFFFLGQSALQRKAKVLEEGKRYRGKIYAYRPDHSIKINDAPAVSVVVRYFDDKGDEREAVCPTGSNDVSIFPVGASVTFAVHEGRYAVDDTSVGVDKLEREEELMDDRLATAEHAHLIAVGCKNCGASYQAVEGYSNRCPYCGTYAEA